MRSKILGAVSIAVFFSGLNLFAGNKSGNGDYCIQEGAKCVRVNFEGDVVHPKGKALKALIRNSNLPMSLKNEMLLDLDRTLVIFSGEVIKLSELLSRYYMQVVSRETETVTNSDGTTTKTVRIKEEWQNTSNAKDYGIFVSEQIGYKAGEKDSLYVRAVTEVGPLGRVIYFTELMDGMSDDEIMKLVLHEQAHRLAYLGSLQNDERFAESWASTVLKFLKSELSKERFVGFLKASGLDKGDSIRFENEEIDAKDSSLHHAKISMEFQPSQFVAQGLQAIPILDAQAEYGPYSFYDTRMLFQLEQDSFPGIDFLNHSPQILSMPTTTDYATESLAYAKSLLFSGEPSQLKVTYKQTSKIKSNQIFNTKEIQKIEIVDTNLEKLKALLKQEFPGLAESSNLKVFFFKGIELSAMENFDSFYFELSKSLLLIKDYLAQRSANDPVVAEIIRKFTSNGSGILLQKASFNALFQSEWNSLIGRVTVLKLDPSGTSEDFSIALKDSYNTYINNNYEEVKNAMHTKRISEFRSSYGVKGISLPLASLDSEQEVDWVFNLLKEPKVKEKISCLVSYLPGKKLKIDISNITYDSMIKFTYMVHNDEISLDFSLPSNGFENEPEKLKAFFIDEMLGNVFLQYTRIRDGFTDYDNMMYHKAKWNYKKQKYYWTSELQAFDWFDPMAQINVDMLNAARKCM